MSFKIWLQESLRAQDRVMVEAAKKDDKAADETVTVATFQDPKQWQQVAAKPVPTFIPSFKTGMNKYFYKLLRDGAYEGWVEYGVGGSEKIVEDPDFKKVGQSLFDHWERNGGLFAESLDDNDKLIVEGRPCGRGFIAGKRKCLDGLTTEMRRGRRDFGKRYNQLKEQMRTENPELQPGTPDWFNMKADAATQAMKIGPCGRRTRTRTRGYNQAAIGKITKARERAYDVVRTQGE